MSLKINVKLFDHSGGFLRHIDQSEAIAKVKAGKLRKYYKKQQGKLRFQGYRENTPALETCWPRKQRSKIAIVRDGKLVGSFTVRLATRQFLGRSENF